jgi:uncharacterized protein (TIGR02678 family)
MTGPDTTPGPGATPALAPRRAVSRPAPAADVQADEERRRAARALLRRPLLHDSPGEHAAERADDLRLVRRHRDELTRLFTEGLGYRLTVEPGVARLGKAGLGRDATRPLLRRSGRRFGPRHYALLCLSVAALTRCKSQLLVDELVAEVRAAAADARLDIDLDAIADRRAMHAALLALVDIGVLTERDGDLEHWAEQRTLALLDVRRDRLAVLVTAPIGSAAGPEELLDVAALPSSVGGARVAIRRRLVESPVLSVTDLTEEQAEWWARNRNRERDWFRDRLGLEVELRAEGALAVDLEDELTDLAFPASGSARHFALLWLERVVASVRDRARGADLADRVWSHVPAGTVARCADEAFAGWGRALKRDFRDNPALARAEALHVLEAMGLVCAGADAGWSVHAAAARYAPRPALAAATGTGEPSLFDEGDDP